MWCAFILCLLALANGADIKDNKKELVMLEIETRPSNVEPKASLTKRTAFPYASPYPRAYPAGGVARASYGAAPGQYAVRTEDPGQQQDIPQEYLEIYQQLEAKQQQNQQQQQEQLVESRDPQALQFLRSPVQLQGPRQEQILAQQLLQQQQQQQQQQQPQPQPPSPPTTRRPLTEQQILQQSFFQSNQLQGQLRSLQGSRPNPTPPGSSVFQEDSPSQALNLHQGRLQSTLGGRDPNYVAQQSNNALYQQQLRVAEALNAEQQQIASIQAQEAQQQQLIQAHSAQTEQDAQQAQTEEEQQQRQYYSQAPQAFPQPAPSSRPPRQRTAPQPLDEESSPGQSPPEQYLRETSPPTQFPPTYRSQPEQSIYYSPREQQAPSGPPSGPAEYQQAQLSASDLTAYLRQQHLQEAAPSAGQSQYLEQAPPSAGSSPYIQQASLSAGPSPYLQRAPPSAAPAAYVRQSSPSAAPPTYVRQSSPPTPPGYQPRTPSAATPPGYQPRTAPSSAASSPHAGGLTAVPAGYLQYVQQEALQQQALQQQAAQQQAAQQQATQQQAAQQQAAQQQAAQQQAAQSPSVYRQAQQASLSEDPSTYLRQQQVDPALYQQVQSATPATPAYRTVPETSDPSIYQTNTRQPQYAAPSASPRRPQTAPQQYVQRQPIYYSRPEEPTEDPESKEFVSSILSQHPGRSVFANANRNEDALSLVKSSLASPSPSRSSIYVSTSNRTPKTQVDSETALPVVRLPTPQGQRALTQREYQALIAAGFDITPVDRVQTPQPSEQGYYEGGSPSRKYQRSYATASPPVNQLAQSRTKLVQLPRQVEESSGFTPVEVPEQRKPTKLSRRRPNVPRKQEQQPRYQQRPRDSYEVSHVMVDGEPESQTTYLAYDRVPEAETSYARRRISRGHSQKVSAPVVRVN